MISDLVVHAVLFRTLFNMPSRLPSVLWNYYLGQGCKQNRFSQAFQCTKHAVKIILEVCQLCRGLFIQHYLLAVHALCVYKSILYTLIKYNERKAVNAVHDCTYRKLQ